MNVFNMYVLSNTNSSRFILIIVWDNALRRMSHFHHQSSSGVSAHEAATKERHSAPVLHCVTSTNINPDCSTIFRSVPFGQSLPILAAGV